MLRRSWETKKNIIKELNNRLNENRIISEQTENEKDLERARSFAQSLVDWWDSDENYNFFCRYNSSGLKIFGRGQDFVDQSKSFGVWSKYMLNKYIVKNNKYYNDLLTWVTDIEDQIDDIFQNVSYLTLRSDEGDIFNFEIDPEVTNSSCSENKRKNKDFKLKISIDPTNQKNEPQSGYNLKVKEANSSSVTLTWEDKTDDIDSNQEDTFEVWRNKYGKAKDDVTNAWQKLDSVTGGDAGDTIEYVDTDNIDGDKEYGYKVYGRNKKGLSYNSSNIVWVTPNKWTSSSQGGGSNTGGSNTGGSNTGGSNTGGSNTGGSNTGGGTTFTETTINNLEDITSNSNTHIKVGLKGDLINSIQTLIKGDGIVSVGKVDSKFGTNTKKGVIEFQKKYGLSPDGIVGDKTAKKLIEIREKFLKNVAKTTDNKETFIKKMEFIVPKIDTSNSLNVDDVIKNYETYRKDNQKPSEKEIAGMKSLNILNMMESEISKPILDMMKRMNIIK
jgi:peptidoglycan hydrolase-like protein with peptidoglycan-binding domain